MGVRVDWGALSGLSGVDRELLLRELGGFGDVVGGNPLEVFVPSGPQGLFLGAGERWRVFFGGNRAGKTTVGVVDDLVQCLDRGVVPERLRGFKRFEPPFEGRVVCPDLSATLVGVVLPAFREWCPVGELVGGGFDSAFDRQNRVLRFRNGSRLQFMTYEMDLDKFGGAALDRVHFDEEPPRDIWNECLVRLITRGGDVLLTMTPQQGLSWTLDELWEWSGGSDAVSVARRDHLFCCVASGRSNPVVTEEELELATAHLSAEERVARVEGRFVHFQGLVLPEFDEVRHVVPALKAVSGDVVVGVDPGIRRTAVAFVVFDRANNATVFDELYLENSTVASTAQLVLERLDGWGVKDAMFVIDPSARNRGLVNAESVMSEFARFNIFCVPGQNDVEAGVFQVKRRLQSDPPGLRVAENCGSWLWERGRYRMADRPDGGFGVVRADNHLMDATRYVLMSRPYVGGPNLGRKSRPVYRPDWDDGFVPRVNVGGPLGRFS